MSYRENQENPTKHLAVAMILATTSEGENRKMNYTADYSYRGLKAADGIPHHTISDHGSEQGRTTIIHSLLKF